MNNLSGCFVAITTPLQDGNVDLDVLRAHATWMVDEGVAGIVVCGTTGESATLTDDEKIACMNAVADEVGTRVPIVAGAGNNCTHESLSFIERACAETRVHALMSVVPYYNKPPQAGILAHLRAVADASTLPIVAYNVPGRTVVGMSVDTMASIAEHPNVVCIKEASGDLIADALLFDRVRGKVTMLSGDDGTAMPFIAAGGDGVISVIANVAPRLMADVCAAAVSGDRELASRLNARVAKLHNLLFSVASPIPTKIGVSMLGFGTDEVRLPLVPAELDVAERIRSALTSLEVAR